MLIINFIKKHFNDDVHHGDRRVNDLQYQDYIE